VNLLIFLVKLLYKRHAAMAIAVPIMLGVLPEGKVISSSEKTLAIRLRLPRPSTEGLAMTGKKVRY